MKADFVFGFIQCMDGEKDPRNLILCFQLTSLIIRTIPEFVRFEEDLFEVRVVHELISRSRGAGQCLLFPHYFQGESWRPEFDQETATCCCVAHLLVGYPCVRALLYPFFAGQDY